MMGFVKYISIQLWQWYR